MSTPSIPVVVMASISFYVGLYHLLIYSRRKQHREDLTFALMCLATGFYDVFCAGLYSATSVVEGVQWQRAQFITLAFFTTAFLWFVSDYTHQKPQIATYAFSAFYLLAALIQIVDRSSLTWMVDRPSVKEILLPLGLEVTYYEATLGPFTALQGLMGPVAGIYIVWSGVRFYRRGYRREAGPLLLALGFVYAAVVNDTLVSNGAYQFAYTIEYAYLAMILLMAYSLSSIVVEAAMAKEALRESEERYRRLFELESDAIFLIDNETGRILEANSAASALYGYSREELLTKKNVDLSAEPEDTQRVTQTTPVVLDRVMTIPLRFHRKKDGTVFPVEITGRFFTWQGRPVHIAAIRDITERKRAEAERETLIRELETRNAELERFTYTVSHDLKSPLITIKGFLGYLEQDALARNVEQMRADLARISNAADKMQQLLDELLELSRIGRLTNPPERVPFGDLAREAVSLVAGRLTQQGVRVDIAPKLPVVYGDRLRLREVLENLIDNAAKFMGDQPDPQVEIGVRHDGETSVFYVRDNGVGIEPRYHEKVFELFEKLDATREGTGVGLALVKRIIELHGGRVWVESAGKGQGSTLCFTLSENRVIESLQE